MILSPELEELILVTRIYTNSPKSGHSFSGRDRADLRAEPEYEAHSPGLRYGEPPQSNGQNLSRAHRSLSQDFFDQSLTKVRNMFAKNVFRCVKNVLISLFSG